MNFTKCSSTELRRALNLDIVRFAYKKLGGDLRTAVGTTNLGMVPTQHLPKGKRQSPANVIAYFDLEKQSWRSVSVDSEIYIVQA